MTTTPPTTTPAPDHLGQALTFTAAATVTRADGTTDAPAPADGTRED